MDQIIKVNPFVFLFFILILAPGIFSFARSVSGIFNSGPSKDEMAMLYLKRRNELSKEIEATTNLEEKQKKQEFADILLRMAKNNIYSTSDYY